MISKGPSHIDFKKCREEIAAARNDFGNRWCKREYAEPKALKEQKFNTFKIVDKRIEFYSKISNLLPPKPKSSFRHLNQIEHRKYVLVPADKAAVPKTGHRKYVLFPADKAAIPKTEHRKYVLFPADKAAIPTTEHRKYVLVPADKAAIPKTEHRKYVLVPADKAANTRGPTYVIVTWYILSFCAAILKFVIESR